MHSRTVRLAPRGSRHNAWPAPKGGAVLASSDAPNKFFRATRRVNRRPATNGKKLGKRASSRSINAGGADEVKTSNGPAKGPPSRDVSAKSSVATRSAPCKPRRSAQLMVPDARMAG